MRGGRWRRALLVAFAAACIALNSPPHNKSLPHDAYVWQRQWTPALAAALAQSAAHVRCWRVLAAEMDGRGELVEIRADRAALHETQKPVVVVVRISRQIPSWNEEAAIRQSVALVHRWRQASIAVAGLEIDHDCGTARLAAYARFLAALRSQLPPPLTLSITALPAWLDSHRLPEVLAAVDESVLQVHAVINPRQGLFNRSQALAWVRSWSRTSVRPFRIALPNYGSRVAWNGRGSIAVVESEVPRFANLVAGSELVVRPLEVAGLMADIDGLVAPSLAGYAWFRLPTAGDRRAWTFPTWLAVLQGAPLAPAMRADVTPSGIPGTVDVYVSNTGAIDEVCPSKVDVVAAGRCEGADSLGPYTVERAGPTVRFRLVAPLLLPAGDRRLVGWVRCSLSGGRVYAKM